MASLQLFLEVLTSSLLLQLELPRKRLAALGEVHSLIILVGRLLGRAYLHRQYPFAFDLVHLQALLYWFFYLVLDPALEWAYVWRFLDNVLGDFFFTVGDLGFAGYFLVKEGVEDLIEFVYCRVFGVALGDEAGSRGFVLFGVDLGLKRIEAVDKRFSLKVQTFELLQL